MSICTRHLHIWFGDCPNCEVEKIMNAMTETAISHRRLRNLIGGYEDDELKPGCMHTDSQARKLIEEMYKVKVMKTPTEEQLRDPKWWEKNAPEVAASVMLVWDSDQKERLSRVVWAKEKEGILVGTDQYVEHYRRPTKPEPDPKQDSFADRIRELGNQVHNLGCEIQNNEVLADGCEQIREQLWYLADQARTVQREQIDRKALTETIEGAVRLGLNEQGISNTVWAAGWRKAGEE